MLRFSLSAVFAAVFAIALFCAALAYATVPWREAVRFLTYFVLLSAVVAALVSKGRSKAVAVGMAVFGWGVLLLVDNSRSTSYLDTGLAWAFDATHERPPSRAPAPAEEMGDIRPSRTIADIFRQPRLGGTSDLADEAVEADEAAEEAYLDRKESFPQIAYMGLILLCSIVGGFVGLFFHARSCAPSTV
jgi:hypothetical protein